MALEEKKMGLPRSHPELPPHQNKRRSGNQRQQPFLPTSGCVTPRREKCQKWSENQQVTTVLGFCTSDGDMGEGRVLRCHHPSVAACFLQC